MLRARSCVHEDVLRPYARQQRGAAHADAAADRGSDAQRPAPANGAMDAAAAPGAGAEQPARASAPSGAASSPRADAAVERGADARRPAPEAAAAAAPGGTVDARHADTGAALAGAAQHGPGPGGLGGSEEVPVMPPGRQGSTAEQRVPKAGRKAPVPSAEEIEVIVLD